MKKKLLIRIFTGFPLGLAIGYTITIATSLVYADGCYAPCVPALTEAVGSEIGAVLLQAILCGILGSAFSAGSLIWEIERWGLVKQTGVYFLIVSAVMMPVAYINCWMERSPAGILGYFGIFVCIFAAVWLTQYLRAKRNVREMNERLRLQRDGENV